MTEKRITKCPKHGLHYDANNRDGCLLCVKERERLEEQKRIRQAKAEKDNREPNIVLMVAISLIIGIVTFVVLWYGFPPPESIKFEKETTVTWNSPVGWEPQEQWQKDIVLQRLGLRKPDDTTWSMPGMWMFKDNSPLGKEFQEYIYIIQGPGAMPMDQDALGKFEGWLSEKSPTTAYTVKIVDKGLEKVGDVMAAKVVTQYESTIAPEYKAEHYYIPDGNKHFIVSMAAREKEWDQFDLAFNQMIVDFKGGRNGVGEKKKLPLFLSSRYRAIPGAFLIWAISLYTMFMVAFKKGD